jgi:hypothetical protein
MLAGMFNQHFLFILYAVSSAALSVIAVGSIIA